jgi:hypothetical protein
MQGGGGVQVRVVGEEHACRGCVRDRGWSEMRSAVCVLCFFPGMKWKETATEEAKAYLRRRTA